MPGLSSCDRFWKMALILLGGVSLPALAVEVLTQHNDNARTGANLEERQLNTQTVQAASFGKIFARAVDDQIYTQPLYVPQVPIPGRGTPNVVYVATVNNSVYAFDADDPRRLDPLWKRNYNDFKTGAVPVKNTDVGQACGVYRDFSGNIGIVGTPVIDRASSTLYFVTRTKEQGTFAQRLHAVDIGSGEERPGSPVAIQASIPGTGASSDGQGHVIFNPRTQNQRMALGLSQGIIYIGWASHCDTGPYHGWLMGYDARTLQQKSVFNTTPDGGEAGIWQAGQGPSFDAEGDIYLITGNGSFNAHQGGRNYGQAFLRLAAGDGFLKVKDWFTPYNYQHLNQVDLDLGASGAFLIPGTDLILGGGKGGTLYLLDRKQMGHYKATDDAQIVQSFNAADNRHIHSSPAYWEAPAGKLVYLWAEHNRLKAYRLTGGRFELPAFAESTMPAPDGMPGGFLSVSAEGGKEGSGILWASHPYFGDANQNVTPGILRAFDANDISIELWNSYQNVERDDYGKFAKFVSPTVANGRVYQSTFSNQLVVYGLINPIDDPASSADQPALTDGAVYSLVATSSQKCLDVPASSLDDGARLQQYTCNNTSAQKFRAIAAGDGSYFLVNVNSKKCLDVVDRSMEASAPLQQWTCHYGDNQRFIVQHEGRWGLIIKPAHSQLCLDAVASNPADGTKIQQWACHFRSNQKWLPMIE